MRIYISADLEGVAGVTAMNHLIAGEFEYDRAREWMTGEVNAACEAALEAGAAEIVISDSHGNGQSLLVEKLPQEKVRLVRSWPRPFFMMQGIEQGDFQGAILLGYHCGSRHHPGTLAHVVAGDNIELRVNREVMSETMLSALTAGHFGTPVIMVSGDSAYVAHAANVLGDVEAAAVKDPYGTRSVLTLLPGAAQALIRQKVAAAIQRIDSFETYLMAPPYEVEFFIASPFKADWLEFIPGIDRIDSHTLRAVVETVSDLNRVVAFVGSFQPKNH